MDENLSFGYWVRRRRKALDLTQVELGRRVGASAAMIRKIEADERRPSRELAALLADALAVSEVEREPFLRAARDAAVVGRLPLPDAPEMGPPAALPPSNLPAPMTSLVNRIKDQERVALLLRREDVRLVTLLGPPGMGKTRLSIQVAAHVRSRFKDGVWFVDLSAVTEGELVLPRVAMALKLAATPGLSAAEQLQQALGDQSMLLVLDNLEQVVAHAAVDIAGLLRACRGLKVLATSRIRLDVYGEHEYLLQPMSLPPSGGAPDTLLQYEAVQLFVARARQHRQELDLTGEAAAAVVEICHRMGGLPLALELAAARLRYMTVAELAAALREASGRDWHALLHTTTRDLPARQQTLFNAVAWSYSLLAPNEQAIFRRLGVFAGHFDAAAAAAVAPGPLADDQAAVLPVMERLVDHNLIDMEAERPARWRLLEMIREFAVAEMGAAEHRAAKHAHAHHFAMRQTEWQAQWLDRAYVDAVEEDQDNFRAALRYAIEEGDASLAHQLGAAMGRFWERRGLIQEGRATLTTILALPGEVDSRARFAVLHEATILAWMQHDFTAAEMLAAASMAWAQTRGLPSAVLIVLNMLGRIYLEQARYHDAERVLAEAVELGFGLYPPDPGMMPNVQHGEAALATGDLDRAEALTRRGLAVTTGDDLIPFCLGWNNLAEVALARGDVATARDALRRVLPLVHLHSRRARIFLVALAGLLLDDLADEAEGASLATRLLGCVSAANARMGDPLSPMTQKQLAARVAATQRQLPGGEWRSAWEQGGRMTLEQALLLARRLLPGEATAG